MVEHNCSERGVHCSGIVGCTKVVDARVVTCEKENDASHGNTNDDGNEGGKAKSRHSIHSLCCARRIQPRMFGFRVVQLLVYIIDVFGNVPEFWEVRF